MITYALIVEPVEDGGYGAWCPDLPGCVALGDTAAEAITEMKEAIAKRALRGHLEYSLVLD